MSVVMRFPRHLCHNHDLLRKYPTNRNLLLRARHPYVAIAQCMLFLWRYKLGLTIRKNLRPPRCRLVLDWLAAHPPITQAIRPGGSLVGQLGFSVDNQWRIQSLLSCLSLMCRLRRSPFSLIALGSCANPIREPSCRTDRYDYLHSQAPPHCAGHDPSWSLPSATASGCSERPISIRP